MADTVQTLEKPAKKRQDRRAAQAAAKAAATPGIAEKRALKRRRIAEANTMTFILETEVRRFVTAQAKAAGMDIAPYMQKIVENHVLASAPKGDPLARRIAAKRVVLDHIVDLARDMDAKSGFDEHFVLNVVKKAASEPTFVANYEAAVDAGTADERSLARAQAPINQQIGRLIKRAAGARSKRDDNGKIIRAQVQGELIGTYTLLEKPG